MAATWKVVGGGDKGGIVVRSGKGVKSDAYEERLVTGAVIREDETSPAGDRLRYNLVSGEGPKEGWISFKAGGKDLIVKIAETDATAPNKAGDAAVAKKKAEEEAATKKKAEEEAAAAAKKKAEEEAAAAAKKKAEEEAAAAAKKKAEEEAAAAAKKKAEEEAAAAAKKKAEEEEASKKMPGADAGAGALMKPGAPEVKKEDASLRASVTCGETQMGECVAIIGGAPALGSWDTAKALKMTTSAESFPNWSIEVPSLPVGTEYKFIILGNGGNVRWEPIDGNRRWPGGGAMQTKFGVL